MFIVLLYDVEKHTEFIIRGNNVHEGTQAAAEVRGPRVIYLPKALSSTRSRAKRESTRKHVAELGV